MMIILIRREPELPPQRDNNQRQANSNTCNGNRKGHDGLTMNEGFEPPPAVYSVSHADGSPDGGEHADFVTVYVHHFVMFLLDYYIVKIICLIDGGRMRLLLGDGQEKISNKTMEMYGDIVMQHAEA
eukprot:CAMPEP_0201867540 /NCGR_PEP_ID=MMETSP0902-20130614/1729_1 /ASSEMBLY_ACC=CAM_ASM_000551 /TAXON_ID=420261 /ORGANISM="Thalassiosira antarctica, Strain CCMP982" /LENGTH=126 /DNA_ID=CAMNT_0048392705 /DNA_START=283 /DNA_END=663 /DNA_ORIENTATION=+